MRLIQTLSSCLCTGIIALFTACSQAPQSPHRFRESVYRHGISRTHVSRGHGSLRSGPTQSGHPERELGRLFRLSLQRFYLNGFFPYPFKRYGMYRPWRYPIPSVTPDTSSVLALGREGFPGLLLGESQGGRCISGTYHDPACRDTPIYL